MKDDVSRIDKFLETLFELDSGDFEQLQDVLLSRDTPEVEPPREGESPAEAARRRSLHEKRKNIANAFFARIQESPPSVKARNIEDISPPDRPISETKSMTLLAVKGPSHALIPGDTGLGDAIIDDIEEEDDPGELSLLPLEGNNPLINGDPGEPSQQEEMSYDAMLGALLISEEREQASLRQLEEQKKRAEANIHAFNERESESLASFDPVPLIAMSESDMINAMLPEESRSGAKHDFTTPLPGGAQSPEAAFLQQMFKERDLTAPLPKSKAPIQNMEDLTKSRSFVANAAEGRRVLAGPAHQQDDSDSNPLSFDSMSGVDDGVLTYRLGAGSNRAQARLVENLSGVGRSISQTLQASGEADNAPPVAHQNTQTLFQDAGFQERRHDPRLSQASALRDSGGQPVVATNTAARMAQMQSSHPTGHGGMRPQDQHGLVPMSPSAERSQNGPSLRPQSMIQSMGPQITGSFPGMSPHASIGPYNHVHPYNTGSFPPISTGMYQMVDGVPQPLHMPPTGQGPNPMLTGSSQWDEPEDWSPSYGGGSRFFFVLVGIALVMFILLGSIWLGWIYNPLKGHENVKKAVVAKEVQGPAKVRLFSSPEGASIFLGDIATGKRTPAVLRLAPGKHTIVLQKKGFSPKTQEVEIKDERNLFFQLSLDAIQPEPKRKVTIYITTSASRAKLYINGKLTKHRTPVFLKVEPGSYAIQVRKRRYRSRVLVLKVGDKPFYHVRVPWR